MEPQVQLISRELMKTFLDALGDAPPPEGVEVTTAEFGALTLKFNAKNELTGSSKDGKSYSFKTAEVLPPSYL